MSENVSEMEFLHLDFWTDNSSELNVYLISPGPNEVGFDESYTLTSRPSL